MNKTQIAAMPAYFDRYINLTQDEDLDIVLQLSLQQLQHLNVGYLAEKSHYAYAPGKWTVNEMFQHIIDAERIFAYRALRFSRNDLTPLPGFEEDDYARESKANGRSFQEIIHELIAVRQSSILLFNSFSEEQLQRVGTASNKEISVAAIGFTIAGHQLHHFKVLKERYFYEVMS
jgi:hypothetical protein